MFKGLDREKFYQTFSTENDCLRYLFTIKWKDGYECRRCGNSKSWKGRTAFHLRCTKCGYDESVTANTIFHKLKFPLLKAFRLIFEIAVPKKGKSSNGLRLEFGVNPKTAYAFRKKAHKAIESGPEQYIEERIDPGLVVDGITITKREDGLNGFQRIAVQLKKFNTKKGRKMHRVKAECFPPQSGEIDYSHLIGGKFKEKGARLLLWSFKIWLTGIHHHCSLAHLEGYLNEFFFRHSYRRQTDEIWHILIERFMISTNKSIGNAA